eukprot:IDg12558t1
MHVCAKYFIKGRELCLFGLLAVVNLSSTSLQRHANEVAHSNSIAAVIVIVALEAGCTNSYRSLEDALTSKEGNRTVCLLKNMVE